MPTLSAGRVTFQDIDYPGNRATKNVTSTAGSYTNLKIISSSDGWDNFLS